MESVQFVGCYFWGIPALAYPTVGAVIILALICCMEWRRERIVTASEGSSGRSRAWIAQTGGDRQGLHERRPVP